MGKNLKVNLMAMILVGSVYPNFVIGAELSAREIMEQNEQRRQIDDLQSEATIVTGSAGDSQNTEKVKKFTWWRKLTDDKIHFNTMTRFHAPAEIRGEGILFLEHDGGDNEVMLYLPNFKKVRRVESQAQSGSFMGSELSYSDITIPHTSDYDYKLLKKESCQLEKEDAALLCHVIEAKPKSDSIRERFGYSRSVNWVREDNRMVARAEYFDLENVLYKTMRATDISLVVPAKNTWFSHKLRIDNVRNKRFTNLEFTQVKVERRIENSIFTQASLSRVP